MNDRSRDVLVRASAYGFVACFVTLLAVSILFGKSYGKTILFTLMPAYSIYYAIMYRIVCKAYADEVKRITAFGIIGRGTFGGATYYASLYFIAVLSVLILGTMIGVINGN